MVSDYPALFNSVVTITCQLLFIFVCVSFIYTLKSFINESTRHLECIEGKLIVLSCCVVLHQSITRNEINSRIAPLHMATRKLFSVLISPLCLLLTIFLLSFQSVVLCGTT